MAGRREEPDGPSEPPEVPAVSCQPPSSPDQSPEGERFFDSRDDRLRRQSTRARSVRPGRHGPPPATPGGARDAGVWYCI